MNRPADVRGAKHTLAAAALDFAKEHARAKAKATGSPPTKRRKTSTFSSSSQARRKSARADDGEMVDSYHYIGYVPVHGRVWELDGLRAAGALDVGDILDRRSRIGLVDADRDAALPAAEEALRLFGR